MKSTHDRFQLAKLGQDLLGFYQSSLVVAESIISVIYRIERARLCMLQIVIKQSWCGLMLEHHTEKAPNHFLITLKTLANCLRYRFCIHSLTGTHTHHTYSIFILFNTLIFAHFIQDHVHTCSIKKYTTKTTTKVLQWRFSILTPWKPLTNSIIYSVSFSLFVPRWANEAIQIACVTSHIYENQRTTTTRKTTTKEKKQAAPQILNVKLTIRRSA